MTASSARHDSATMPTVVGPPLAQVARLWVDPVGSLTTWARRHGDLFALRLPAVGRLVVVGDPSAAHEVIRSDPASSAAGSATGRVLALLGPSCVLRQDGAAHSERRRMLNPLFHGDGLARRRAPSPTSRDASWRSGRRIGRCRSCRACRISPSRSFPGWSSASPTKKRSIASTVWSGVPPDPLRLPGRGCGRSGRGSSVTGRCKGCVSTSGSSTGPSSSCSRSAPIMARIAVTLPTSCSTWLVPTRGRPIGSCSKSFGRCCWWT